MAEPLNKEDIDWAMNCSDEGPIDILAAEVRRLREALASTSTLVADLRAQIESKNAAIKCASDALDEDVIVRTMQHPDGRVETWVASEIEQESERMQESIDLYRATIARVEALCDSVDAKYLLVDDNSTDENMGKARLFLALDDVRAAVGGEK